MIEHLLLWREGKKECRMYTLTIVERKPSYVYTTTNGCRWACCMEVDVVNGTEAADDGLVAADPKVNCARSELLLELMNGANDWTRWPLRTQHLGFCSPHTVLCQNYM